MSDEYAAAGVDTAEADLGVAAIIARLKTIETGRASLTVPLPGHYASVMRLPVPFDQNIGIALATDSVGSKVIIAEQTGRFDTVGIDCMAMNVNDLICVGARPLALLDYIAVEEAEPKLLGEIAKGLAVGATQAAVEIPGGEVCQVPEVLKGHPSPYGFDLVGSAFGVVEIDRIIDGAKVSPGDVMIGLPASGVHSNGLTLARRALLEDGGYGLGDKPELLDGASVGDVLLEPTVIYVRAVMALIDSGLPVHGLANITGGGLLNLRRIGKGVGYRISAPLPVPPVFELIADCAKVSRAEMWQVFNMGTGFYVFVAADAVEQALETLRTFHPGAAVVGEITDCDRVIEVPSERVHAPAGSDKLLDF